MARKGMGKCPRCKTDAPLIKVTKRVFPPKGGKLCGDCIAPSALDAIRAAEGQLAHTDQRN